MVPLFKLKIASLICEFLPPIISQQVRSRIISIEEGENLEMDFKKKSFTGGILSGNTKDFHAFKFYIHGYFDWRNVVLCQKILKIQKGDIIEVGANIGTETISLALLNPMVKVHAIEPVPLNFKSLENIKVENKLENLHLYNLLVSDKAGTVGFKMPSQKSSGSGHIIEDPAKTANELKVDTLNNLLSGINACSSILIDVEGFEYKVLKGATDILEEFRPFVIMEVNEEFLKNRTKISVSFLYDELIGWGYEPYNIGKLGLTKVRTEDFKKKANKNWLCIPKDKIKYKNYLSRAIFLNSLNPFIHKKII